MKLDKYEKLKQKLEILKLEKNFSPLNFTLYWFSFLGNIFLVYFGYFFIKTITDSLPDLFPYQTQFFIVFIALFLIGYELIKRFVIDQTAVAVLTIKKATSGVIIGVASSLFLITGSFYMSLNGAHRLVDTSSIVETKVEETTNTKVSELEAKSKENVDRLNKQIESYQERIDRVMNPAEGRALYKSERETIKGWEAQVDKLRQEIKLENANLEQQVAKIETKTTGSSEKELEKIQENSTAFMLMTFFLEFLIILGVSFNAFYTISTYKETTQLLQTPKYRLYLLHLQLLKIYYNGGKNGIGDLAMSYGRLLSVAKAQKLQVSMKEIKDFIALCSELQIIRDTNNRRKQYSMTYDQALALVQKDEVL